jgi:hypothetical protein
VGGSSTVTKHSHDQNHVTKISKKILPENAPTESQVPNESAMKKLDTKVEVVPPIPLSYVSNYSAKVSVFNHTYYFVSNISFGEKLPDIEVNVPSTPHLSNLNLRSLFYLMI